MKILVVDDEPIVREGLVKSVNWEFLGIEVVKDAKDGKEALKIFSESQPDIVLTDIRMPYIDGLELTKEIKKLDPFAVVILLSAYDEFMYAQQAVKLGAFDYILKPIDIDILMKTIKDAIDKRKELIEKNINNMPFLNKKDLKFFKAEHYKYPLELEEELSKAIKRGESELSLNIFNKIWDEFNDEDYSLDFIKRWGIELIALITRSIIEIGENADVLFKETDPWLQISSFTNKNDVYIWMKNLIEIICEYVAISKGSKNKKLIEQTLQIINIKYCDKDISLNSIAEMLYVTPNYLSTLFKIEMGITFSDYLLEFRVTKAKELLEDIKVKIYEVAEAVGYSDPHYFSKIFKNVTGFTPKEYREKIL